MSAKKRKEPEPSSLDGGGEDPPTIRNISTSVSSVGDNKYSVSYTVAFTKLCRCSISAGTKRPRLKITSERDFFADGADTAALMMNKTIDALLNHDRRNSYEGLSLCDLDIRKGVGASYMFRDASPSSIWRHLYASAEIEINNMKFESYRRSQGQLTQHKDKNTAILKKGWELGEDFVNANEKSRAMTKVGDALILATKNSVTKATILMSDLVSKLVKSPHFDEDSILTEDRRKEISRMTAMIKHACSLISKFSGGGKAGATTRQSIEVMTGVCALFIPPSGVPLRWISRQLGLNRDAKYVSSGIANREAYENFLSLTGPIAIGEMIQCRGGYGELKAMDEEADSVTITLHPWMQDVTYHPKARARMVRYEPNLMSYERKTRSDVFPSQWVDTIVAFHYEHNHPSPNTKDQVCRRHSKYPRQKEYAPVIYRYETFDQLWTEFQKEHVAIADKLRNNNHPNECPSALRKYAPWNMIKGKDSSCLCINCEGTNAVIRGVKGAITSIAQLLQRDQPDDDLDINNNINTAPAQQSIEERNKDESAYTKLQKIYDILGKPSKYDKCVACLPCLTSRRLEDSKFKCIDGSCEVCGFDKLWKHGVRARIFVQEYDDAKGEWVGKLNQNSALGTDVWLETMEWRDYSYKTKPTVATHAQEVARQAAIVRPPDDDDLDYEPTKSASARNLILETRRGTLVDYLDGFEGKITMHIEHRNLVSSEHRSKLQYSRNSRPLSFARDIDFAENGTIENFDKVQSEHWVTKQYTLFMSVSSFLEIEKWNRSDGELNVGDEVTVNGERYIGNNKETIAIAMDSYWAKVVRHIGVHGDMYQVEDEHGSMHDVRRSSLRHRCRHTICCGHVSDDKLHDRFAMQQFTTRELAYLEQYMSEKFPNDLINGRIKRLHQHSDNASQHFKSTGAMEYFTSLIADRGGASECLFVYSFGAPGHGKGVFDGVGGAIKNKVHSLIKATKTSNDGIPGVASGYINSVEDVFQAVQYHFENEENHVRKKTGSNPINHFHFFSYLSCNNVHIERRNESFDQLCGISSNYQFVVNNIGRVYMRQRSCWCLMCMSQLVKSSSMWGDAYAIGQCVSRDGELNSTLYKFQKQSCRKQVGLNVQQSVQRLRTIKQTRNEITMALTPGDWLMFESPEPNVQPFWIGRAVSKREWNDACWYRNETGSRQMLSGALPLDSGEYAINVQWYDLRDIANPLEYVIVRDNPYPIANHNSTLVLGGFEMTLSIGNEVRVPRARAIRDRNDAFGYAQPQLNLQTREGDWYRSEFGNVYLLSEEIRNEGIARCTQWAR